MEIIEFSCIMYDTKYPIMFQNDSYFSKSNYLTTFEQPCVGKEIDLTD